MGQDVCVHVLGWEGVCVGAVEKEKGKERQSGGPVPRGGARCGRG